LPGFASTIRAEVLERIRFYRTSYRSARADTTLKPRQILKQCPDFNAFSCN